MAEIIQEITLDISKESEYCKIEIPQGDFIDRIFYIKLINDSSDYVIPATALVTFNMLRIGAEPIFNSCPITTDGKIKFTITPAISAISGRHPFTFTIDDSTSGGSTSSFVSSMIVKKGIDIEKMVVTTGEYTQLKTMMQQVGDVVTQVVACKEATDNANAAIEVVNAMKVWEVYDNSKAYEIENKVSYLGSSYLCVADSTGNLPTNTSFWMLIASKGDKGDTGANGIDGTSPTVTVKTSTSTEYILDITDKNGTITTPNLKGVDGTGGDMTKNVYDTTGKNTDVFTYVDDQIGDRSLLPTPNTDLVVAVNEVNDEINKTTYKIKLTNTVSEINAILSQAAITGGRIVFEKGNYDLVSDIKFVKNNTNFLKIYGQGVTFTGTGKFILDSVKRVSFDGFDIRNTDICLRGVWWTNFTNVNVKRFVVGDIAGTMFNEVYWNTWTNCIFGQLLLDINRTDFNANTFNSCSIRSTNDQGFQNSWDYNIQSNVDGALQKLIFNDCDISYATVGVVSLVSTRNDNSIDFNNCYFDTKAPVNITNAIVTTNNCFYANNYTIYSNTKNISLNSTKNIEGTSVRGWYPTSTYNIFKDGTFITGKSFGNIVGGTLTYYKTGGMFGGYVNINQTATTSNSVYFTTANTIASGYYNISFYIKNAGIGTKNLKFGCFGMYRDIVISDTEWTFITFSSPTSINSGVTNTFELYTNDSTSFSINISSISCTLGTMPILNASIDYNTFLHNEYGTTVKSKVQTATSNGVLDIFRIIPDTASESSVVTIDLNVNFLDRNYIAGGGVIRANITLLRTNGEDSILNIKEISNFNNYEGAKTISLTQRADGSNFIVSAKITEYATVGESMISFTARILDYDKTSVQVDVNKWGDVIVPLI
jgi:hypothetical protein